jgi:hypothetical protein
MMQRVPPELIARASRLFWDIDPEAIDPSLHEDFIIARVLVEGDWDAVQALRREVSDAELIAFCRRAGHRLDRRTQRFVEVVLRLEPGTCKRTSWRNGNEALFVP